MTRFFCSANRALSQWFPSIVDCKIVTFVTSVPNIECQISIARNFDENEGNDARKKTWLKSWNSNETNRKWTKTRDNKISLYSRVFLMFVGVHSNHCPTYNGKKKKRAHSIIEHELKHISADEWKAASSNRVSNVEYVCIQRNKQKKNMKRKSATISHRRLCL